jgi:hypothetical protein
MTDPWFDGAAPPDGHDYPGLVDQRVPCVAAIDDVVDLKTRLESQFCRMLSMMLSMVEQSRSQAGRDGMKRLRSVGGRTVEATVEQTLILGLVNAFPFVRLEPASMGPLTAVVKALAQGILANELDHLMSLVR